MFTGIDKISTVRVRESTKYMEPLFFVKISGSSIDQNFLPEYKITYSRFPAGWAPAEASNVCLKAFGEQKFWDDARASCRRLGGDLATIKNPPIL